MCEKRSVHNLSTFTPSPIHFLWDIFSQFSANYIQLRGNVICLQAAGFATWLASAGIPRSWSRFTQLSTLQPQPLNLWSSSSPQISHSWISAPLYLLSNPAVSHSSPPCLPPSSRSSPTLHTEGVNQLICPCIDSSGSKPLWWPIKIIFLPEKSSRMIWIQSARCFVL